MRAVIHLVVRVAVAATAQAQKPGVPTAGAVRTMVREAQAEAKGDNGAAADAVNNGSGDTASLHAGDVPLRLLK